MTGETLLLAQTGEQQKTVNTAERAKVGKLQRAVRDGERTGLPPGFEFKPVSMTSRGVFGAELESLLDWLAGYGASHNMVLLELDVEGQALKAALLSRFRRRLSVAIHRDTMEALAHRAQLIERVEKNRLAKVGGGGCW